MTMILSANSPVPKRNSCRTQYMLEQHCTVHFAESPLHSWSSLVTLTNYCILKIFLNVYINDEFFWLILEELRMWEVWCIHTLPGDDLRWSFRFSPWYPGKSRIIFLIFTFMMNLEWFLNFLIQNVIPGSRSKNIFLFLTCCLSIASKMRNDNFKIAKILVIKLTSSLILLVFYFYSRSIDIYEHSNCGSLC